MTTNEATGRKDDSAVSPVIGVILMVAITVILAAVIGTFVLGLGDATNEPANAGVQVDENTAVNSLTFTVVDPGNVDSILIDGPNGRTPELAADVVPVEPGVQIKIREGGFPREDVRLANFTKGGCTPGSCPFGVFPPPGTGAYPDGVPTQVTNLIGSVGTPHAVCLGGTPGVQDCSAAGGTFVGGQIRNLVEPNKTDGRLVNGMGGECLVRHGQNFLDQGGRLLPVFRADIGCTGAFNGVDVPRIEYEPGGEYSLIGVVDGEQTVLQTATAPE